MFECGRLHVDVIRRQRGCKYRAKPVDDIAALNAKSAQKMARARRPSRERSCCFIFAPRAADRPARLDLPDTEQARRRNDAGEDHKRVGGGHRHGLGANKGDLVWFGHVQLARNRL